MGAVLSFFLPETSRPSPPAAVVAMSWRSAVMESWLPITAHSLPGPQSFIFSVALFGVVQIPLVCGSREN